MLKIYIFLLMIFFSVYTTSAQRSQVFGGQAAYNKTTECISEIKRIEIKQKLSANIEMLKEQGKLHTAKISGGSPLFEFPMQFAPGFDDYGFYCTTNFVDENVLNPGFITDYNCGSRSYDLSGYNHQGIDYVLWPFDWNLMQTGAVEIIAAAPGTIIGKYDGNEDDHCAFSSDAWNAVYIMYDDGSISWYGHMKKFSTTTKSVGETMAAGEYLGLVGSSGSSTAPHLHFETYDAEGFLIDPYAGDCNLLNTESWWEDQPSYYDPKINKLQTHFAPPEFTPCPDEHILNDADEFNAGDLIYFVTYFRDQRSIDLCEFSITDPDGILFDSWEFYQPADYYIASYWYWSYPFPDDATDGIWTFACTFAGETYTHEFVVNNGAVSISNEQNNFLLNQIVHNDGILHLNIQSAISFDSEFFITDNSGRKMYSSEETLLPGENFFEISSDLAKGMYIFSLAADDRAHRINKKFFVE
ncbi:MAG: M23 family metallopeptidase [Fimbriimonadaceae bacterium]|nr:M23 family metallopeptidase [Chitinophagales bacterium]